MMSQVKGATKGERTIVSRQPTFITLTSQPSFQLPGVSACGREEQPTVSTAATTLHPR